MRKMRQADGEHVENPRILRELQVMLLLGVKAEIQALDNLGNLPDWLDEKLSSS